MMGARVLWTLYLFVCLSAASTVCAGMQEIEWKDVSSGIKGTDLHSLSVAPGNPDMAYASSYKTLYKTKDGGQTWAEVLSFRGTENSINTIAADPLNSQIIYAGTAIGLYRSSDQGLHWERIFNGVGKLENVIFSVTVGPDKSKNIYIGTAAGIFFTHDSGNNWGKGQNLPSEVIVVSISLDAINPQILFAASDTGIYKSLSSGSEWKRIYGSDLDGEDLRSFLMEESEDTGETDITVIRDKSHLRKLMTDPSNSKIIYAGTSEGLLTSNDGGATWAFAGSIGLVSHNIRNIAVTSSDTKHVYAATDRGIFRYSKDTDSWDELYQGMASSDIRHIDFAPAAQNGSPVLWAVTKMGAYKSSPSSPAADTQYIDTKYLKADTQDVLSVFSHEPSIEEIKEAAIEYAEVSPGKIREWRKAAANKAWLPDLNFSYDKSKDWQRSGYFYSGKYIQNDITKGKDNGWSVSLTWQLGELIWNNDQTSIDNRSKLMVQLRDDVLNEVTRLYFERRRLQIDLVMSPPGDNKVMIEKELRLQELTANIDALTGSFLSRRLAH